MRRNRYPDGSIESSLYDALFGPADRMTESFMHNGRYSLYGSYEDIDDTAACYRSPQESSNQKQYPGQTSGPSWLDNDMTRQLQNLSLTRAMFGESWGGSYTLCSESDAAIARLLQESDNSHLSDDAAIARELQEMEDSIGSMSLHDGPFGSLTDSTWEDDRAETPVRRVGTSVWNVPDVDLDNMSYEGRTLLQESLGTAKKGLSKQAISMLNTHKYTASQGKAKSEGDTECVICKMEYERGEKLATLPCAHQYHEECIKRWLEDHKECCVCKAEVTV